jgi:hypothetical protein
MMTPTLLERRMAQLLRWYAEHLPYSTPGASDAAQYALAMSRLAMVDDEDRLPAITLPAVAAHAGFVRHRADLHRDA